MNENRHFGDRDTYWLVYMAVLCFQNVTFPWLGQCTVWSHLLGCQM